MSPSRDWPLNDKIKYMAKKFPKGKLVKFYGTTNIVWYVTNVDDARIMSPVEELAARTLDIGIVTSDPYTANEAILVAITSHKGRFTLSWTTASRLSTIEEHLFLAKP